MILNNILKTKTASVWGLGYLGYTTILKLQKSGFNILAYDLNMNQMNMFLSGNYPDREQTISWSRMDYLPKLDLDKVKIANTPEELFKSSYLHIIAVPEDYKSTPQQSIASKLAKMFSQNLRDSKIAPLIVFESAFVPGHIERYFVELLKKEKINCSKDYYLGASFRTDWTIEAFISQRDKIPIAGYCRKSLEAMRALFNYLEMQTVEFDSLKEAEIYVNCINTIQAMVNDFVRQLAIGYPSVNMKKLSELLFKNVTFEDCTLNIGTGGTKMTYAIDHLIQGSDNPEQLTLLKEFQDINISSVLNYAEYITRHSYKSVAILGVTYKGNQKDLTLSPAITLADFLLKNSVKVMLSDPFYTKDGIGSLVKGVEAVEFPDGVFSADVLVVACDHNQYKYLSQSTLNRIPKNTKLIIDNYGIWSHLSFGNKIKYHQVGDGTLNIVR